MPSLKAITIVGLAMCTGLAACRPARPTLVRAPDPCAQAVVAPHLVDSSWHAIPNGSIPVVWELPSAPWRPLQARQVASFSRLPLPSESHERGCLLELVAVRVWRAGCGAREDVADVQLIFSPDLRNSPRQEIAHRTRGQTQLIHDLRGDLERAEVVAAGGSSLLPVAPPANTVFHLVVPGDGVRSEVVGVRTSPWDVVVYTSHWTDLASKPQRRDLRVVAELTWPSTCNYRIQTGTIADAVETADELDVRLAPCRTP